MSNIQIKELRQLIKNGEGDEFHGSVFQIKGVPNAIKSNQKSDVLYGYLIFTIADKDSALSFGIVSANLKHFQSDFVPAIEHYSKFEEEIEIVAMLQSEHVKKQNPTVLLLAYKIIAGDYEIITTDGERYYSKQN